MTQILSSSLRSGLDTIRSAVAAKSTLPVLMNAYISSDNGRLRLAACNLESGIVTWIGARMELAEEIDITVPYKLLADLTGSLSGTVDLTVNSRTATVLLKSNGTKANVKGISADEFPPLKLDIPASARRATIDADELKGALDYVAFAASSDPARPTLTGIHTVFEREKVTLEAADGFRLGQTSTRLLSFSPGADEMFSANIPAKCFREAARLIKTGPVEIGIDSGQAIFKAENLVFITQLIDGSYPDLGQVIPKKLEWTAVIETAPFLAALQRIRLFSRDGQNMCKMIFEKDQITLSGQSDEVGDCEEVLSCETNVEDTFRIAFNNNYLIEAVKAARTEYIWFGMNEPASPGVVREHGNDVSDWLMLLMPMLIGE